MRGFLVGFIVGGVTFWAMTSFLYRSLINTAVRMYQVERQEHAEHHVWDGKENN